MINFAEKTLRGFESTNGITFSTEELFLNEGLAHLAEELTGWGICTPILAKIYFDCFELSSLTHASENSENFPVQNC